MAGIGHHAALVYTMVLVSASDRDMTNAEIRMMGEIIAGLPVFADFDRRQLAATARACAEILDDPDGLAKGLALIKRGLPKRLRETAYALACDVAAADGTLTEEELRLLAMIRQALRIDHLISVAIERGARAHFAMP